MIGLLVVVGCGKAEVRQEVPWVPEVRPELGAVVARVQGTPIFAAEVAAQAAKTRKSARQALDDLVAFHVLAERVRDEWPPRDEKAQVLRREVMVQRFIEREFEARARPEDMPDTEVRQIYESARHSFVHGRLVEIAVVQITLGKNPSAERRAKARETGAALEAEVKKRKARTTDDFQSIATSEPWMGQRVRSYHFRQDVDNHSPYSSVFSAAVARLKKPGDVTPLITDDLGLYIASYIAEIPPRNVPFEQVRQELRDAHYPRWRKSQFEALHRALAAQHVVELNLSALAPPQATAAVR